MAANPIRGQVDASLQVDHDQEASTAWTYLLTAIQLTAPQRVDGASLLQQELQHHAPPRHTEGEIAVPVLSPNEKIHDDLLAPMNRGMAAMVAEKFHLLGETDLTMALLARMADLGRQLKHRPHRGNVA